MFMLQTIEGKPSVCQKFKMAQRNSDQYSVSGASLRHTLVRNE